MIPLTKSGEPLFRQVYRSLRQSIVSGAFPGGHRLPSTRDLAEQLGISRTVVLLAYELLLSEGFVVGRGGSGTYVASGLSAGPSTKRKKSVALPLSRFGSSAAEAAASTSVPGRRTAPLRYDFVWRSDMETFPFEAWRRILLRQARAASIRAHDYGPAAGTLALREAIAAHLRRSRAVVCDASEVIIVNGSQQALDLIARVLLERGDIGRSRGSAISGHARSPARCRSKAAARAGRRRRNESREAAGAGRPPGFRHALASISHRHDSSFVAAARAAGLGPAQKRGNRRRRLRRRISLRRAAPGIPARAWTTKDASFTSGHFRAPFFRRCALAI